MPFRALSRAIPWLVIAASALSPAQANAGVRQAPQVKGSLERSDRECDSDRVIGLRIAICSYGFFADPALDGDPDHAYTAEWTQIALEPLSGHCIAGARGSIRVEDASITSRAPSRRSRPGRNAVQLRLATPDQALGSLRQRFGSRAASPLRRCVARHAATGCGGDGAGGVDEISSGSSWAPVSPNRSPTTRSRSPMR